MAIHLEPSRSGLQAETKRMETSAHNVANASTDGFQRQVVTSRERASGGVDARVDRVQVSEGAQRALSEAKAEGLVSTPENDVDPAQETVNQIAAKSVLQADASVIRIQDRTLGALLDATG